MVNKLSLSHIDSFLPRLKFIIRIALIISFAVELIYAFCVSLNGGEDIFPYAFYLLFYMVIWVQFPAIVALVMIAGYRAWRGHLVWSFVKTEFWWVLAAVLSYTIIYLIAWLTGPHDVHV